MGGTSSGGAGGGRSQSGLAAGRAVVRLPAHTISPGSSAEGSPRTGAEAHPDSLDGLDEAVVRRPVRAGVPMPVARSPRTLWQVPLGEKDRRYHSQPELF